MGSLELKKALHNAGLTPEEFADVLQVDPKSVTRWLAGQATPYPRHRANIARALNHTQHDLWPELHQPLPPAGEVVEPVNEVIGSWATPHDPGVPDLAQLVLETDGDIDMFEGNQDFKPTAQLVDALITAADNGRHVRFMSRAPTMLLAPLIGHPNIQLAVWEERDHWYREDYLRAGDTILRGVRLDRYDDNLVVLLIKRQTQDGLYDRITAEFENGYWDHIEPDPISDSQHQLITNLQTLQAYAWEPDELDQATRNERTPNPEPPGLRDEPGLPEEPGGGVTEPPADPKPSSGQRRWPGRTD